jgi:hypothetical protein
MDEPPESSGASRRSSTWVAALVGGIIVVAVVVLIARTRSSEEPAPSGPEMTAIEIVTEPAGATVSFLDGGVLGTTPLDTKLPKRDGELPVIVRLVGYQERRVTVPLYSETGRIDVSLTAIGAEPPPPPKPLPKDWSP